MSISFLFGSRHVIDYNKAVHLPEKFQLLFLLILKEISSSRKLNNHTKNDFPMKQSEFQSSFLGGYNICETIFMIFI